LISGRTSRHDNAIAGFGSSGKRSGPSLASAEKERAVTSANEDLPLPHLLRDLALD